MLAMVTVSVMAMAATSLVATAAVGPVGSASAGSAPRPQGVLADPSFTDSLVTSGVSVPVAVTPLPDGRVVVLQKTGEVRIIRDGVLLPIAALSLSVCSTSERGLLGFEPDPAFAANGLVYLYYTRPSASAPGGCVNRVSRFVMTGDTIDPASEAVLLDNIASPAGNHNGGDVGVGSDGYLYVSVGDGGCDPRGDSGCAGANDAAQDLSLLNGKILRIDRLSGAPAPGNPFSGAGTAACAVRGNTAATPGTACQEVFAYGLRNPWRFAMDPNTGATRFFINDVGQNTREEVDLGAVGANYGWPTREGQCAQGTNPPCPPPAAGVTQPLTDYQHGVAGGGDYITGGAFVPNGAWGSAFDGGYLFGDGSPGAIYFRDATGTVKYQSPFATGVAGISDMQFVMDTGVWSLYYVLPGTNEVRKIVPTLAAPPAVGALAFTPITGGRVFDSRDLGADTGVVRAGTSRLINVVATQGNHRAALVNITMVRPPNNSFLTAWQPRSIRPTASNLNVQADQTAANASVVPIDADGNVIVFTNATTNVIVDVLGFFDVTGGPVTAGRHVPVTPNRAIDTRNAPDAATNDYSRTTDGTETVVNVPLAGRYGLPTNVGAAAIIVTALSDTTPVGGNIVAVPHGGAVPPVSNVNTSGNGDRRPNLVIVPIGADGSIDLRLRNVAGVIVDVVGSFTDATVGASTGGLYVPLAATRVVDTRIALGFGRLPASGTGTVNPSTVPDSALAITQNVVIVATGGAGFMTSYPAGLGVAPLVSNGNATAAGQVRSTLTITPTGTGASAGAVSFFASMATDVVVDVTGYFQAAPA
jgi:glucose/arabinose dehydrogenase